MTRVRVKICGLTRAEDAHLAVELGADAVGFVFWPGSPRHVTAAAAREIAARLPPFVTRVGVFVNATRDVIADTVSHVGLDVVQLHGDERVEAFTDLPARLLRAVSLLTDHALDTALGLPPSVMPLVDAADRARRGGTGHRADWVRAAALSAARPIVLAGGLSADTVARAVADVRPWAVDVASGVETAPGIKSPEKLRAFFAALDGVGSRDPASGP